MVKLTTDYEIEFKSRITKSDYSKLIKKYSENITSIKQQNSYFDTEKLFFDSNNITIRIREKENIYTYTMKSPYKGIIKEESATLSQTDYKDSLLQGINISFEEKNYKVFFITKSNTNRTQFKYMNGTVFLDKTEYRNGDDYEVEFEVDNIVDKPGFTSFLKENDLTFSKIESKRRRALKSR